MNCHALLFKKGALKMIAAIYSRKSVYTEKGESIENQINLCKQYIDNNYKIDEVKVYEDEGYSGKNIDRPHFQMLLSDIRKKKIDVLVCYRLDRVARNVADFSNLIQELDKLGVSFVSISEQFDTSTPLGRAMMMIASVFAQLERETIAERVKDNMMELSKTGRWLGGNVPLGFNSEPVKYYDENLKEKTMYQLIPVDPELETVKLIYKIFLDTRSAYKTAAYLCTNKYTGKNGGEFSRGTVEQIIKNPVYCSADKSIFEYFKSREVTVTGKPDAKHGLMSYNKRVNGKKERDMKEWIIAPGKHPSVISSKDWITAQKVFEENKLKASPRSGTSARGLLSGMLICKKCGSGMSITSKKITDDKYEYYYRCNLKNRASSRCSTRNLPGIKADKYVIEHLKTIDKKSIIENYDMIKGTLTNNDLTKEIYKLKKELENNTHVMHGLIRKFALLPEEVAKDVLNEIENIKYENNVLMNRITHIQNEINEKRENGEYLENITMQLDTFAKFIDSEDISIKRNMIKSIVENIVWDSDTGILEVNLIGCKKKSLKEY